MSAPLVVLKLGGSVLRDPADLSAAVHEVYRHVRRGARVLAVVSAFHGRTDALARIVYRCLTVQEYGLEELESDLVDFLRKD